MEPSTSLMIHLCLAQWIWDPCPMYLSQMRPFSYLACKIQCPFFPKTREHVSTVFRSISDDFRPRELGGVSAQNSYIWHFLMQRQTVLSDNDFLKYFQAYVCGYVHSMTVSQTIPPEVPMVMRIQQWVPPLAFTQSVDLNEYISI